jgi:hypothetical protein
MGWRRIDRRRYTTTTTTRERRRGRRRRRQPPESNDDGTIVTTSRRRRRDDRPRDDDEGRRRGGRRRRMRRRPLRRLPRWPTGPISPWKWRFGGGDADGIVVNVAVGSSSWLGGCPSPPRGGVRDDRHRGGRDRRRPRRRCCSFVALAAVGGCVTIGGCVTARRRACSCARCRRMLHRCWLSRGHDRAQQMSISQAWQRRRQRRASSGRRMDVISAMARWRDGTAACCRLFSLNFRPNYSLVVSRRSGGM